MIQPNLSHFSLDALLEELEYCLKSRPIICSNCGSSEKSGFGYRKNKNGDKKRYKCKNCGKKYTDTITRYGNQKLSVHDQILDLAVRGVKANSIREIVNKTLKNEDEDSSITKPTVLNIIKKDCQFLSTIENHLCHNNFSSVWEMDETFDRLTGGIKCYVFNSKAVDTKYWLASYPSLKRNQTAQKIALTQSYNRAEYAPDTIRTDGFAPKLDDCIPELKHCKIKSISKKIDFSCINDVERINLSMRETIPKGKCAYSIEHLYSLAELKRIHYNFLQKHPTFGNLTPAKIVGIDPPHP